MRPRSRSLPDVSSLRNTAPWRSAGRVVEQAPPAHGESPPEAQETLTDARPATPQQQGFVRQLLELADGYEQQLKQADRDGPFFVPEAGLKLLDRLIDCLPQAQSVKQVQFVLTVASTVPLSRPYVPLLMAVMERLAVLQDLPKLSSCELQGGLDVRAAFREVIPQLNRCSASEQMIVVCAYVQACASLGRKQGATCLHTLHQVLREPKDLMLETSVWIELDTAINQSRRRAPPVPHRPAPLEGAAAKAAVAQGQVAIFDLLGLPVELQQLVINSLPHPYEAQTWEEWQAIGRVIDALNLVNKAFHVGIQPMVFAKGLHALRKASGPRVFATLHDPELPMKLRAITEHPLGPPCAGQCLVDLARAAGGIRHAMHALAAQQCLLDLVKRGLAEPAVPYAVLPTLLVAYSPLWDWSDHPFSAFLCFQVLVQNLGDLPDAVALPALIEAALRALQHEIRSGGDAVIIFTPSGTWRPLSAAEVLKALSDRGYPLPDMKRYLDAVAAVLASGDAGGEEALVASTVIAALRFMQDCPYPLVGSLAKALKTIQRHHLSPYNEGLVAACAKKLSWCALALQGDGNEPVEMDSAMQAALFPNHHIQMQ